MIRTVLCAFDWVLQRHPSHPPTKKPAMNLCVILIEWLLVYASRAKTDQAVRPTQDMLISGLSVRKHYHSISLQEKGISYLPADTFVDFPNITVRCACLRSPGYNHLHIYTSLANQNILVFVNIEMNRPNVLETLSYHSKIFKKETI